MSGTINITLQYFGAFRVLGQTQTFSLSQSATCADLMQALGRRLSADDARHGLLDLLPVSKLATDSEILGATDILSHGGQYAIIPPVSGG